VESIRQKLRPRLTLPCFLFFVSACVSECECECDSWCSCTELTPKMSRTVMGDDNRARLCGFTGLSCSVTCWIVVAVSPPVETEGRYFFL
jgi:hypothetical protein